MIATLRSELRKIATTRTWWIVAGSFAAYMVFLGVVMAFTVVTTARQAAEAGAGGNPLGSDGAIELSPLQVALTVYTLAVSLGYAFPAALGAFGVTSEFRHRTITPTLLADPRRGRVLAMKLVAVLPFALAVGIAGVLATILPGAVTLAILGEPTMLTDPEVLRAGALCVVGLVLWALVGVGFGSVLTNQVAAIVVLIGFTQFVEPILRLLFAQFDVTEGLAKLLPGAAGEAIVGTSFYAASGLAELLEPWQGGLVLAGYAVVLVAIGRFTTFRRDIG